MHLAAINSSDASQSVSPSAASAQTLTDQAARWADLVHATQRADGSPALPPAYVTRKALTAVAFSLRHGLRDLAVPTKLVGVKANQHAVEALALYDQLPVRRRPRLAVTVGADGTLAVSAVRSDGSLQPVGRLQPKHVAWATPLLGAGPRTGLAVHLHAVTGLDRRARGLPVTLGVNVRLSGLDGASGPPSRPALRAVAETTVPYRSSGGGRSGSAPPVLAVRLWRDGDGTARMTCPHAVRHSPSGPEWGYGGSGPADCARSVLLALADAATADAHYQAFKADVISRVPDDGAVISRAAVAAWLAGQTDAAARPSVGRAA
ncbi:DUF6166 domain-containing protein [Rubrivirga marina]|jgi:hypothetical protein|nr:DUF6166 domain-containing protein [Rubrivirga marina]